MTPLCTVQDVKNYLGDPTISSAADTTLTTLINFVSSLAVNQANLPDREDGEDVGFFEDVYREHYDGNNSRILLLRHCAPSTPVTGVQKVTIDGRDIPKSPQPPLSGFVFDRFSVRLRGYFFTAGQQNVEIRYAAGFPEDSSTAIALKGAAAEWVAQMFKQRTHIDVRAKTLDRETVSFVQEMMPIRMAALLNNLKMRMAA